MYLGFESGGLGLGVLLPLSITSWNGAALGMIAAFVGVPCWGDKLEELVEPPLPGSEQFKLQQSLAIETSGVSVPDCAFLQQSGMLAMGQEPSPSCAPKPTAPPSIAATKVNAVSHFRIGVSNYIK